MPDAPARSEDPCIDARDHQALADRWCAAPGHVRRDTLPDGTPREHDWPVPIEDPTGAGPLIRLHPVHEEQLVENRVHLDVVADSAALQAAGATVVRASDDRPGHEPEEDAGEIGWDVLADPEGDGLCCFPPPRG
ncbi:VOC family protein [Geodermatophilus sp. SYSU D00867]